MQNDSVAVENLIAQALTDEAIRSAKPVTFKRSDGKPMAHDELTHLVKLLFNEIDQYKYTHSKSNPYYTEGGSVVVPSASSMKMGYDLNPHYYKKGEMDVKAPNVPVKFEKNYTNDEIAEMYMLNPIRRPTYRIVSVKSKQSKIDHKFQLDVQKYIRTVHPELRLREFNDLQLKCKFLLSDPLRRHFTKSAKKVRYGQADLLRFLGYNYHIDYNKLIKTDKDIDKTNSNPLFYQIKYPHPDVYGNVMLDSLKYVNGYDGIVGNLYIDFMTADKNYKKNPKKNRGQRNKIYTNVVQNLSMILDNMRNPISLSALIEGQKRPMKEYNRKSFFKTLVDFNSLHLLHSSSKGKTPPAKTNLSLVDERL